MALQDEIFDWLTSLEEWKQELFLRVAAGPVSEEDIAVATRLLLGEPQEGEAARRVQRDDLPDGDQAAAALAVTAVHGTRQVNALGDDQRLDCAATGITLIFGANGTGKTAFSRIFKHAGRTLHREPILPNQAEPGEGSPRACLSVRLDGEDQEFELDLEQPAPSVLGKMCVFDAGAAQRYVSRENAIDYVPGPLRNLEAVAEALDRVAEELDRRIEVARPQPLDLTAYGTDTEVSRFLAGLNHGTTDRQLTALAGLNQEQETERAQLAATLGEIESRSAPQLRQAATREADAAERLGQELSAIAEPLSAEAISQARAEFQQLEAARQAVELAAQQFAGEPVAGVGSDPWRALWEAAQAFAASQHEALPPDHDAAYCLLCMQELDTAARARLQSFESFVTANVGQQLRQAERAVADRRQGLPDVAACRDRQLAVLEQLGQAEGELGHRVDAWLSAAEALVNEVKSGQIPEGVELPVAPSLEARVADKRVEAARHAELENSQRQAEVRRRLAELEARAALAEGLGAVKAHLDGLREVRRLEEARGSVARGAVSNTVTSLTRDFVRGDLDEALNEQLRALNFDGLEVATTNRTVAGTPFVGLCFKTVDGRSLEEVLSTGEQRRVALAMFLAELTISSDNTPVVLDDPVSSIDQEGRRHIARTLARLAQDRQVIVLTHELSFVVELSKHSELERPEVPVFAQYVKRVGRQAGIAMAGLPWEGLKPKERIPVLKERLEAVAEAYASQDQEVYEQPARSFCDQLRRAFERAVELDVLGGVVKRGDEAVHTLQLDEIVYDDTVRALVARAMTETSCWLHDRAEAQGWVAPTIDELGTALEIYEELVNYVAGIKKQRQKERDKRKATEKSQLTASERGQPEIKLRAVKPAEGDPQGPLPPLRAVEDRSE